ncbi:MAG: O-antigen ligase family protein [Fuerstiella sp.]|nr:O-antigen ligase family protein [Fuerstiella sp.]
MSHLTAIEDRRSRISNTLLKAVDVLIGALIFGLPFIMGGREAWGHWFLISVAFLLGATWATYATIRGCRYSVSWFEAFFIAGLAIVAFQVQPQSPDTMQTFSPEYQRLLPTWTETQSTTAETSHAWSTLSLTPTESRHGWWIFLAYAVITTILFQRVRDQKDCHQLLQGVAIVGVAMTGFALFQWATSNDRFFWFYEHPYTEPTLHLKGAFTNRNHFAQFLSLTIGPLLWWLVSNVKSISDSSNPKLPKTPQRQSRNRSRSKKTGRQVRSASWNNVERSLTIPVLLLLCGVSVVILAVLLSLSRGGMIAAGAATLVALIGLWRGFKVGGAMAGLLLGGGVLFLSLLSFADQEQVQTKIDQLISTDADEIDSGGNRRAVWAADAKVIQQFPWLGTGVGSHRDVYSMYMENYADFAMSEMTHAESSFVQVALETGFIGAGCLALALIVLMFRLTVGYFRRNSDACRACTAAVAASAAAGILHAVTDFIWYVPAIVVISLVLMVVGLKAASRNFGTEAASAGTWFPRAGWAVTGGLCLLAFIRLQPELQARIAAEKHWYAFLRTELEVQFDDSDGYADLKEGDIVSVEIQPVSFLETEEPKYNPEHAAREEAAQLAFVRERIEHLTASLKAAPDQHRVQLVLSEQLLRLFDLMQGHSDNPMPLKMIRDAAVTNFSDAGERQDWVKIVCEDRIRLIRLSDQLLRDSLKGCPVQGHAYLTLLDTAFATQQSSLGQQKLIDQAMLVRGHDPRVRFVAGREALLNGDKETALQLWESVFHSNQYFRLGILKLVASQLPAEFFIEQFQPNADELLDLLNVYDLLERERDSTVILNQLCEVIPEEAPGIEDEDEREEKMLIAYQAARKLDDLNRAIDILRIVIEDFPLSYKPRYHLGMTLVELERPQEALDHLKWCHDQDPGNIWVPDLIRRAREQILELPEDDHAPLIRL